eukprot:TRINITY_DN19776_c1_g1_i1.p1 TRINITY_DN19776_c1_g1~~TRINITY_DN19776_c1_g1_i1.p1  ORF type:complete len:304 (-),score=27.66 TRINITY_DN19776_c1_g1_i1:11-922(-)
MQVLCSKRRLSNAVRDRKGQQKKWATGEKDRHDNEVMRQPTPDEVVEVLRQRGCGKDLTYIPGTVKWVSHFRVNSRQTNHYGTGRVWLAGDACHCHSPLGGQGMNMGFNDAKNIAWKLAYAAKGVVPLSLLQSYENERQPIEHKILLAIERGQKAVSSRNPVVFFMRGRGQRLAPVLINFALDNSKDASILQYGTQQAWTYMTSELSYEHWERPVPGLCCLPGVLARKNQNLLRWIGSRVRAGDSVPDAPVGDSTVHGVLKRSRGWTLILFEGSEADNDKQETYVRNVKIMGLGKSQKNGMTR